MGALKEDKEMKVKKFWSTQFLFSWVVLVVCLLAGIVILEQGMFTAGVAVVAGGMVLEVVSAILMWKNFRCPNCRRSLNRRMLSSGRMAVGMIRCPHCGATMPLE